MKRLLVDLLFFTGKQGGTETVAREIYSRFHGVAGWEFVGFASNELAQKGADWFPGTLIDSGLRSTQRPQWAWGELFGVARAATRSRADLIHSPANFGPPRPPVPLVLTLHDMLAFKRPEFLPSRAGAVPTKLLISGAARAATHIVTDSDAAKADILAGTGTPAASVTVVRPGATGRSPHSGAQRRPDRVFSLGNRMPHKNFQRLIEALALIPESERPVLTISGSHGDDPLRPIVRRAGLEKWVELRGWLPDDEIQRLYGESTAMVFPTLFEGFGLPVLEAMVSGCPVICSDIPVLREVGGDAATYFDPLEPASIAQAIRNTLSDPAQQARSAQAGVERATLFSWDEAARQMLAVFSEAHDRSGRRG